MPVNIKFRDRRKYYDCFDMYAENGDISTLADLIAEYEAEELNKYIAMLE